jgi:hypothetical protein
LESALHRVPRKPGFYSIDEFDLESNVKVAYQSDCILEIQPSQALTLKPYSAVMEYVIRTGWCSTILKQSDRKDAANKAKETRNSKRNPLFTDYDVECDYEKWIEDDAPLNLVEYTSFCREYVYQFFCPNTEKELKKKGKKKTDEYTAFPETFQVVMMTSQLLKHIFREDCLHAKLMADLQRKEKDYKEVFGTLPIALTLAHKLEAHSGTLPLSDKIPLTDFRRVVNTNLASIAAFFAYAIYDEQSFSRATALLYQHAGSGDPIPNAEHLFPGKNGLKPLVTVKEGSRGYLFHDNTDDDGGDFIANVIEVINHFAEFLRQTDDPLSMMKKVYSKGRIQALLFRTLASDLVEIYASHGCYPLCAKSDEEKLHPWLKHILSHNRAKNPVPLLMEYIIILIEKKAMQVSATHVYDSRYRLVSYNAEPKNDGNEEEETTQNDSVNPKQRAKPKLKQKQEPTVTVTAKTFEDNSKRRKDGNMQRPLTRNIRYLYKMNGAKNGNAKVLGGDAQDAQDAWMTLPEVVNVILFGMRNPWHTKINDRNYRNTWLVVYWSPELPILDKKDRVALWVKPKEIEPKATTSAEAPNSETGAPVGKQQEIITSKEAAVAPPTLQTGTSKSQLQQSTKVLTKTVAIQQQGKKVVNTSQKAATPSSETATSVGQQKGSPEESKTSEAASLLSKDSDEAKQKEVASKEDRRVGVGDGLGSNSSGSSDSSSSPLDDKVTEQGGEDLIVTENDPAQANEDSKIEGGFGSSESEQEWDHDVTWQVGEQGEIVNKNDPTQALEDKDSESEQDLDVKVHEKFLEASNRVLELINMGTGNLGAHYPEILESVKTVSMTIALITGLQLEALITDNATLSVPNDINNLLLEIQNLQIALKKPKNAGGYPVVNVVYQETPMKDHHNMLEKLNVYLDQFLPHLANMEGWTKQGMPTLNIQKRDGPACIIKDLTGTELTRRCVWHKGIDESAGDKKPAAKTTNPRQIEAKRKRDEVTKATSENDAKRKKTGEPEEQSPQRARTTPARRARPPDRFSPSGGSTYAV